MRAPVELEDQAQILATGRVPTVETLFVLPSPWAYCCRLRDSNSRCWSWVSRSWLKVPWAPLPLFCSSANFCLIRQYSSSFPGWRRLFSWWTISLSTSPRTRLRISNSRSLNGSNRHASFDVLSDQPSPGCSWDVVWRNRPRLLCFSRRSGGTESWLTWARP